MQDLPWLEESSRNMNVNGHRSRTGWRSFLKRDLQGSGGSNAANAMHDAAPLEKGGVTRRAGSRSQNVQFIALGPRDSALASSSTHPRHPHPLPPRSPYMTKKGSSCDVQVTVYNRSSRRSWVQADHPIRTKHPLPFIQGIRPVDFHDDDYLQLSRTLAG